MLIFHPSVSKWINACELKHYMEHVNRFLAFGHVTTPGYKTLAESSRDPGERVDERAKEHDRPRLLLRDVRHEGVQHLRPGATALPGRPATNAQALDPSEPLC